MKYQCTILDENTGKNEQWDSFLYIISRSGAFTEFVARGRGSSIHGIVGPQANGNFLCLPSYGIGSELAAYTDVFRNCERLTPLIGLVDAVTLATGLKYLKNLA